MQDGFTYVVQCSTDNSQGAYSIVGVSSGGFSKCFSACEASSMCAGWTYSGTDSGNCYLKDYEGTAVPAGNTIVSAFIVGGRPDTGSSSSAVSVAATSSSGASTSSQSASATPSISPRSCGAIGTFDGQFTTYIDGNGKQYRVACKHEVGGSILSVESANTFDDCFSICDKTGGCAGFSWLSDNGPGNCYLKTGFNPLNTIGSSAADVAILIDGPISASASGSASATGSATASASATASSSADSGCGTFDTSAYPDWTVECKTDRNGGNLYAVGSSTFGGCFPLCKQASGCIGFSYAGNTCYLKSSLVAPNANANVDTAYMTDKLSPSPTTSSSAASTTPTGDPPSSSGWPKCWYGCFQGYSSADQLCGNAAADQCVKGACDAEDYASYETWKQDHCGKSSASTMKTMHRGRRVGMAA